MANILLNIEKGIEVGAEDALKFLTQGEAEVTKTVNASPKVLAALGTLAGGLTTALEGVSASAATPLNIALDVSTVKSLAAVWPEVKTFLETLGIKF